MPPSSETVTALVLKESPYGSATGHWFPEVPGIYVPGEPVPVPDGATKDEIAAWIEASGDRLSRTTMKVKVEADAPAEAPAEEGDE